MKREELYRCGLDEIWRRQIGSKSPRAFAHRIGGSQDLIQRLEKYAELEAHRGCVNTVHFNPTGEILVSGSDDTDVIFWDWAAKTKILSFSSGHEDNVFQARIMPFSNDKSVVTCAADGQVRHSIVSETGVVQTVRLAKHRGRAHKLAIEPGSPRTFFSCGEDGAVRHFDLREQKSTRLFFCTGFSSIPQPLHLNAIVINQRNPNLFAVGGSDAYARVYDVRKVGSECTGGNDRDHPVDVFAPKHLIDSKHVHITCLAYSLQEELVVSYNDEHIYLFDKDMGLGPGPTTATELKSEKTQGDEGNGEGSDQPGAGQPVVYKGHRNAQTVKGVNFFGPNTEYVVSGSDCGHVFLWKKRDGELVKMMKGDLQIVNCLEPHPFTTVLATSGIDSTVKIWSPTAVTKKTLPGPAAKRIMERNDKDRLDKMNMWLDIPMLRLPRRQLNLWRRLRRSSDVQEAGGNVPLREDLENLMDGVYSVDEESEDEEEDEEETEDEASECIIT